MRERRGKGDWLDGGKDLVRSVLQTKQIPLSTQRESVSCMAMFAAQLVLLSSPLPPLFTPPLTHCHPQNTQPPTRLSARVLHLGLHLQLELPLLLLHWAKQMATLLIFEVPLLKILFHFETEVPSTSPFLLFFYLYELHLFLFS